MRKIVLIRSSNKNCSIGINTKGVTLVHHPNFERGIRKLKRLMVWKEEVLRRRRVK